MNKQEIIEKLKKLAQELESLGIRSTDETCVETIDYVRDELGFIKNSLKIKEECEKE